MTNIEEIENDRFEDKTYFVIHLILYVSILVAVGWLYFYQIPVVLETELTKNFVPTAIDLVIAVGLCMSLNYFWDHVTRINIIVMNKRAIEFAKNEVNSKEVSSIPFGKR